MPLPCQKIIKQLCFYTWLVLLHSSCSSGLQVASSKFNNANDLTEIKANVILADNTIMNGYLTINNVANNKAATIRFPKQRSTIEIPIANIKAYEIEDAHYTLKLIEPVSNKIYLWGKPTYYKSFVKRLTPIEYTIQLFSSEEKIKEIKSSLTTTAIHYYVEFSENKSHQLLDLTHENFVDVYHQAIKNLCANNYLFAQQFQADKKLVQIKLATKSANDRVKILMHVAKLYAACKGK